VWRHLALFVVWFQVMVPAPLHAQGPREIARLDDRVEPQPARAASSAMVVFRPAPAGLSMRRPYARGRVPVVFIHGLWATPVSWERMVATLEADRELCDRYQFWTFGYSTGDPIPYSACLLRRSLEEARRRFDLDNTDASFDRMVLVGHSMGGLLAKMTVVESGTRLWREVSDRPFDELAGEPDDRNLFGQALLVRPLPGVRRVVFIATPHRGSQLNRGWLQNWGMRLVRGNESLRSAYDRLLARNAPAFFTKDFRKGPPTSIEELEWDAPFLRSLRDLVASPDVKFHSIIAVRAQAGRAERTDGLVSYASAHLEGASSEVVISAGHLCQDHPEVIREVRRVLLEHRSETFGPEAVGVRRGAPNEPGGDASETLGPVNTR
jgi:pimeloyl-ACP methyl ester carboxylesterase